MNESFLLRCTDVPQTADNVLIYSWHVSPNRRVVTLCMDHTSLLSILGASSIIQAKGQAPGLTLAAPNCPSQKSKHLRILMPLPLDIISPMSQPQCMSAFPEM